MLPSEIYMGIVYDTMRILKQNYRDFYLNIKPKCGYSSIIQGHCFTTYGEAVQVDKEEYNRLDNIRLEFYKKKYFKNGPIVFLQANDDKVAHSGDITSLIYKRLGASGFVTDGIVRDIDIIDTLRFPVFCRDENPIDALGHWALTKYQCDIEIDGVFIKPDDYAFASRDGVIIVRNDLFNKFKEIALRELERENKVRSLINNEDKTFKQIVEEMGRW
jgi:regulator of RNase E activity RraA